MATYVTAKKAEEFESLADLDEEARASVVADASRIERYIDRDHGGEIDEDELRKYGERNDLPPDRLNPALAFLQEAGRVLRLGE